MEHMNWENSDGDDERNRNEHKSVSIQPIWGELNFDKLISCYDRAMLRL